MVVRTEQEVWGWGIARHGPTIDARPEVRQSEPTRSERAKHADTGARRRLRRGRPPIRPALLLPVLALAPPGRGRLELPGRAWLHIVPALAQFLEKPRLLHLALEQFQSMLETIGLVEANLNHDGLPLRERDVNKRARRKSRAPGLLESATGLPGGVQANDTFGVTRLATPARP